MTHFSSLVEPEPAFQYVPNDIDGVYLLLHNKILDRSNYVRHILRVIERGLKFTVVNLLARANY